jgi:hypothetical protein
MKISPKQLIAENRPPGYGEQSNSLADSLCRFTFAYALFDFRLLSRRIDLTAFLGNGLSAFVHRVSDSPEAGAISRPAGAR